jgi:membrane protease YdiL (CAAX protease family)
MHGAPPPGWYPDPWRQSWYRWWDGGTWTPHLHPVPGAVVAPRAPHVSAVFSPVAAFGILVGTFLSILLANLVGDELDRGPAWLLVVIVYVVLFGAMTAWSLFFSWSLGSGSLRKDFGFSIKVEDIGWGAAAFAAMFVARIVLFVVLPEETEPVRDVGDSIDLRGAVLAAFAVAAILGAPLIEELVFRGVLQRGLTKVVRVEIAIAVQAVLFAGYHFIPYGDGFTWFYFLALVIFGVVAGIAVDRTGRLGPGIIAHAINNSLAVFVMAVT